MLLLVLLNVCSKIEFFPTCPTCVYFLLPICSLFFRQVQNVSQDWDAHLTRLGLLMWRTCPGNAKLWHSCRFALFRWCLFILDSTPRTWNKQVMVKIRLTLLGWMTPSQFYVWYMKEEVHGIVFRIWSWSHIEEAADLTKHMTRDWMWPKVKGMLYNSLLCQWLLPGTHLLNLWHCKEADLQASENLTVIFFFLRWALLRSTLLIFSSYLLIYDFTWWLLLVSGFL